MSKYEKKRKQEEPQAMINDESISRINELAKKKKTVGLTDAEAKEQQELRQMYIKGMRTSLRSHLDNIKFVDEDDEGSKPH
jgi:uncharacterized protein YnzC (UPF0291/DUF896 family)